MPVASAATPIDSKNWSFEVGDNAASAQNARSVVASHNSITIILQLAHEIVDALLAKVGVVSDPDVVANVKQCREAVDVGERVVVADGESVADGSQRGEAVDVGERGVVADGESVADGSQRGESRRGW